MVGDNTNSAALILVRIANAAMLVIATPDTLGVRRMVDVTHTHGEDESTLLRAENSARCSSAKRNWRAAWPGM